MIFCRRCLQVTPRRRYPTDVTDAEWALIEPLIPAALRERVRRKAGRNPDDPSRAIIDAQSVKTTEVGGETKGLRRGKQVKGRKRHVIVDSMGLLLSASVTGADVQNRDDAGHRGEKGEAAAFVAGQWDVRIVTRREEQKRFEVQPIRWIVGRTFA